MKEWNELDPTKIEKQEIKNMSENMFNDAIVVISNLIARATTKWNLEETKLFLCSVTQIKFRGSDDWVQLSKHDIAEKLEIDPTNRPKLREMFRKMMIKSFIQIDGETEDDWNDGFLITNLRSDKKNIYVKFNSEYMPLLDKLSSQFTQFYLDCVKSFTHLSSYHLYVFLNSWYDPNYQRQNKKIKKSELHKLFNLNPSDYWRNYGTDKEKFDWADFEKYVLKPAIDEINELNRLHKCDMNIYFWEKVKKGKYVLGYDIYYVFTDKDGFPK